MTLEHDYDAILLVSFGAPEKREDVIPFLQNVLRGRNVPAARMQQVAKQYYQFNGVSPLSDHLRKLIPALQNELQANSIELPIYWGNRNWHPILTDIVRAMQESCVKRALAFVTSAYSSYSSCRQYLEDIETARRAAGEQAPTIDKIRAFYNHPNFIEANLANVGNAIASLGAENRSVHVAFTAHSIPTAQALNCQYELQLTEASRLVAERAKIADWKLVFQSRSGHPSQPWLEPDICDHLLDLARKGVADVVVCPIGFMFDHMEVVYDLDIQAKQRAQDLHLNMARAETAGSNPLFIQMIRMLIEERLNPSAPKLAVGLHPAAPDFCAIGCCRQ